MLTIFWKTYSCVYFCKVFWVIGESQPRLQTLAALSMRGFLVGPFRKHFRATTRIDHGSPSHFRTLQVSESFIDQRTSHSCVLKPLKPWSTVTVLTTQSLKRSERSLRLVTPRSSQRPARQRRLQRHQNHRATD